jgi:hypothetical protein
LFFEWRHVIRDLRRESEYGELRRVALEHLSKKYGPEKNHLNRIWQSQQTQGK